MFRARAALLRVGAALALVAIVACGVAHPKSFARLLLPPVGVTLGATAPIDAGVNVGIHDGVSDGVSDGVRDERQPASLPAPSIPKTPFAIQLDDKAPALVVYPPSASFERATSSLPVNKAPLAILLHGMCTRPEHTCGFLSEPARDRGFLACPGGNGSCGGDLLDWTGPMQDRIESVQTSLTALEPLLGPRTAHDGTVLIGYSRGAYLARDVLYSSHDKYLGAVFLAALIDPDPVRLKAAGVRRVVVGCGDYDGAKATLKRAAQKLPLAGIETRFVSFGPMGHGLPEDMGAKLGEALDWIREVKDTD